METRQNSSKNSLHNKQKVNDLRMIEDYMKLIEREYKSGDEVEINKLYKIMTGINRTKEKWEWEWLKTWDGKGAIYLLFDKNQLIAQYSLIPTPFCIFGKNFIAGKTENCMCHPKFQKQKLYFPHEKKSFEKAKERFDLFFTTAGGVSKWAAAAVRKKLGYVSFDSWAVNYFCLNPSALAKQLLSQIEINNFNRIFVSLISVCICAYCKFWLPGKNKNLVHSILDEKKVDLDLLETFWVQNKKYYGVTIDRSRKYLDWRIVQNPHFNYKFILSNISSSINGYLIFHSDREKLLHIDDVVVEQKNPVILKSLIKDTIAYAIQNNMQGIVCRALKGNSFLRKQLYHQGFVDLRWYAYYQDVIKNKKQFLVYTDKEITMDPKQWYITNLITEGRE
ncbi:hypothetical protein [Desulfosudis oleivorans]|nr:hypothetical protein [Desulfosudis oleivorans]